MATIRDGQSDALVIVDTQVGVLRNAWDASRIVANIARVVERARAGGIPVLWVQHGGEEISKGTADWQWVPELNPAEGEPTIHKQFNSAFEETELDHVLERLAVTRIVLAGAMTNWCIRATAYGALERGYDLLLVKDGHTTESIALPDGSMIEGRNLVTDLNVVLTWSRYPGRTSRAVPESELKFALA